MESSKQTSITRRLILSFCVLIAIILFVGLLSIYSLHKITGLTQTIYSHPLVVSNAALQANNSIIKMHRNMKDVVLFKDPEKIRLFVENVNLEEQKTYQYLDLVKNRIIGEKGKKLENEARVLFGNWRPIRQDVISLVLAGQKDKAANITIGQGADHVVKLEETMIGLMNYARGKAASFTSQAEETNSRLNITFLFILLIIIMVSAMIVIFSLKHTASSEKELIESRQLLVNAIDYASIGMVLVEPGGKFHKANESFCKIIGYSEKDLSKMNFQEITHPDDHNIGSKIVKKLIDKEIITASFEKRYVKKDGTIIDVYLTTSLLRDAKGSPLYFFTQVQDVTKRKEAEAELRKSENKLRDVLDATPFPVAVVDLKDDKIFYWSRSALDLFGHTAPTAEEWYQIAYPDPQYRNNVIERWKPFLEEARQSGQPVNTGQYRVTCKDGSERICELYASFLPDNLIVTFNDITERKFAEEALIKSKEQYQLIVENISNVVWTMDMNLRNTYVSPSVYQQRGYTPEEVINQTLSERVSPDSIEKVINIYDEKLKLIESGSSEGWEPIEFEIQQPHKDGSIIWTTNTVRLIKAWTNSQRAL